tara:strand:- start:1081 stop:1509 length:429 start_codon:yes stop_codon:yes gene_type:complete
MRLSHVILGEILYYDPDFEREVERVKDQGGKYLGSGDYGSAYLLNGRVYKVTTDSVELEHAHILKGKKTNNFAHIYDVEEINEKLGIIQMEVLGEFKGEIPEEWIEATENEAKRFGISPDELDIRPSNVMVNQKNHLKLVDI